MQAVLFDDRGECWDPKSHRLADALHASLRGDELITYVIKNLGFIAVTDSGGSLRIRLRPDVVSQVAFGSLLYWLYDRPISRVMLSLFDSDWTHEMVRSRDEVVARLMAMVSFKQDERDGDFLNKPRALQNLPRQNPLRALLEGWAECSGKYDPEKLNPLLQKAVSNRFFLVENKPGSPTFVVRDVGNGYSRSAEYWLSKAIGHRVEDQPDHAYGKWLAEVYANVLRTGTPSLDDVDAVITWPQQPRISYRYQRLVMPFASTRDSTLLLSATVIDSGIDLRVKPA